MPEIVTDDAFDFPGTFPRTWAAILSGFQSGLHTGGQISVSLQGKMLARYAFGLADVKRQMKRDSLAPWLSAGKPLTAVAVMQVIKPGDAGLDTPVSAIIPEFVGGGKEQITVRHLLTHTAGLRTVDQPHTSRSWEENIARICQAPVEADWIPGKMAGYQISATWFILAEIVRRLSGEEFPLYLRRHVLAPWALRDTWLGMPVEAVRDNRDRVVRLCVTQSGQSVPHPFWSIPEAFFPCQPGASALGPMRDLCHFYESMLQGIEGKAGRVLTRDAVLQMISRQRVGMMDQTFQKVIDWGLGFIVNFERPTSEVTPYGFGLHASPSAFGHGGSQSAMGFADPTYGLAVGWHLNGQCGEPSHLLRNWELNTAIYEDLAL